MRKRIVLGLLGLVLALGVGTSFAQTLVVNPGWETFVIREGATSAPFIIDNDLYQLDSIEVGTIEASQKVGLATDLLNGATISQIGSLHIDRLDPVANSGSLYGPYFNIWITDGAGHYAVIANEPSNAEWGGEPWDVSDWDDLKTKTCKVYETPGASTFTSWVHNYAGIAGALTFEDVAGLVIAPPSIAYIQDPLNAVGGGAPDVLGTDVAYGFTWVFGDTMANYVSGDEGFVVNNYSATKTTLSVVNVTQVTSFNTIEAALADANAGDTITIGAGIYNPPSTLLINDPLTLSGASEAGVVINIPAAGGYGFSVTAGNVIMENFTLAATSGNEQFPIHASGTAAPLGLDNLTIQNMTITGAHRRTGFDIHGFSNVVLSHLTSSDAWGGNGLQVTGCVGVTMGNITALNNAWGSMAIYCSSTSYLSRPSSFVTVDGTTLNFDGAFFSQDEFGFFNNNIVINGWAYNVQNSHFREAIGYSDSEGYTFFAPDQATAYAMGMGFTGYEMYSAMFNKVAAEWEVLTGLTVQAAVEHADDMDTVSIFAGTFVAPAQIVIDKNLVISGDPGGASTIAAGFNTTGGSYDPTSSMIYVDYGVTATIKDLNMDGLGFAVQQAIQSRGADVTVQNCTITNIMASIYDGRGIVFLTGDGLVQDCTMSDIQRIGIHIRGGAIGQPSPMVAVNDFNYTGKGIGDYLDYGVEFGGGGQGSVDNATITACLGIASVDDSDSAGILVTDYYGTFTIAEIVNSTLTGNSTGVVVGYDEVDISEVSISGTDLSANTTAGVSSTGVAVAALDNWWGHASGPLDTSDDTATGGLYNPLGQGVAVSDNVSYYPWVGAATATIDPAVTGPITCSGSTSLTFWYNPDVDNTLDLHMFNATISAGASVTFGTITNEDIFNGTGFYFVADNDDGSKTITASTYAGPTHDPYEAANGPAKLFTINFVAATEGTATITMEDLVLRDPVNATIPAELPASVDIVVDCTAPDAVTGITALPHHNRIGVSWGHTGVGVDHYEVFSGLWHDGSHSTVYPEYDDIANSVPARPADYLAILANAAEWDALGNVTALTTDQIWDPADRGIYYYEVFAVDEAGNVSPPAAANDRATNYWLGDMDSNGTVAVYDMGFLGAAFGTHDGDDYYQADADVGPTDDWSATGIPSTDNYVNFEDLMVFSMNYGVVDANNKNNSPISAKAVLAWADLGNNQYSLQLVEGLGIKGIHIRSAVTEGSISGVTAGQLLDDQSEMTFLRNIGDALDISVAVTGVGNGFTGNGDLFIVSSNAPIDMSDLNIEIRGHDNSSIQMSLEATSGVLTPRVFALEANYPNPFNPMTKISFSLPEAQNVRLTVYGIDGKKVATLVNETRSAGLHEVLWMGQNDAGQTAASGLYFYRIEAGPYSQVRKMTLMK